MVMPMAIVGYLSCGHTESIPITQERYLDPKGFTPLPGLCKKCLSKPISNYGRPFTPPSSKYVQSRRRAFKSPTTHSPRIPGAFQSPLLSDFPDISSGSTVEKDSNPMVAAIFFLTLVITANIFVWICNKLYVLVEIPDGTLTLTLVETLLPEKAAKQVSKVLPQPAVATAWVRPGETTPAFIDQPDVTTGASWDQWVLPVGVFVLISMAVVVGHKVASSKILDMVENEDVNAGAIVQQWAWELSPRLKSQVEMTPRSTRRREEKYPVKGVRSDVVPDKAEMSLWVLNPLLVVLWVVNAARLLLLKWPWDFLKLTLHLLLFCVGVLMFGFGSLAWGINSIIGGLGTELLGAFLYCVIVIIRVLFRIFRKRWPYNEVIWRGCPTLNDLGDWLTELFVAPQYEYKYEVNGRWEAYYYQYLQQYGQHQQEYVPRERYPGSLY